MDAESVRAYILSLQAPPQWYALRRWLRLRQCGDTWMAAEYCWPQARTVLRQVLLEFGQLELF